MSKVILYQVPGGWGEPSISPFSMKLEAYLALTKTPYETGRADPRRAPKGRIPYAQIDGELIGDSQFIIEHLKKRDGDPLDAHLTEAERALGHAVRRTVEEGMYFVGLYARWIDDEGWRHVKPAFQRFLPAPLRLAVHVLRSRMRKRTHYQGIAAHTKEEVYSIGARDLDALSTILGDKRWLLGERPTSYDATLYGFLEAVLSFPGDTAYRRHAQSKVNLVAYRDRVRAELGLGAR